MKLKLIARIVTANGKPQYPDTRTNNDLGDTFVPREKKKNNTNKNDWQRIYQKEEYERRIRDKECVKCGEPAVENKTKCQKCLKKDTDRKQIYRNKQKAQNKCVQCSDENSQPVLKGLTVCNRHRKINSVKQLKYHQRNRMQNVEKEPECQLCHTPALSNKLLCETHLNNLKRILRKKEEQGTCALLACTRSTVEGETLCKKHQKEPQPCLSCKKELKDNDYGICQECAEFTA